MHEQRAWYTTSTEMHYIFEHAGVMMQVDYDPGPEPTYKDIRVLDGDYNPVGPDLTALLDVSCIIVSPPGSAVTAYMPTLSVIADELPSNNVLTASKGTAQ